MKRKEQIAIALLGVLLAAIAAALAGSPARAQAGDGATVPPFISPYHSADPLEKFLVFTAAPRADVPDGQIHWTDQEVPGIDVLGPDGDVHSMCPDDGLAWSVQGGDPFGGGNFVALECQGRAEGWQVLAFHLCEVKIGFSIDNAHRLYTRVPSGAVVGRECGGHTHLSLGYRARANEQKSLPCPQWYVQERYWANPACLVQANRLPQRANGYLADGEDWELRYLTPQVLNPLRQLAAVVVGGGLILYLFQAFVRPVAPKDYNRKTGPAFEATIKSGAWLGFLVMLVVVSIGPVWTVGGARFSGYTADDRRYQAVAEKVGYRDWQLLEAFYVVAVPRDASGQPVSGNQPGKVFPPEAAAVIPFGETDTETWSTVDPTMPGPYGRERAWDAVAERWPLSLYEQFILGLTVSRQAQLQREGLQALADSPDMQRLGRQLGKTIRAEDLYGSSAGAVGRTQILPGYFAAGRLCGDMGDMDVWNDPLAVAECTTRYLTVSGCWGSWWANGDVWSALCGYNPGAWNDDAHQWYWNVLQDRMARLTAASEAIGLAQTAPITEVTAGAPRETHVSTPVLGLLITQSLLENGQSAHRLPGPIARWVAEAAPKMGERRAQMRILYRLFRAWTLIYYSPEDLLALGVQL
jgi:hypothetical protein